MTGQPAQPGTSMDRMPGQGAAPDTVTADPDPALARWENEGGFPQAFPAVTERGNHSSSTADDAAGR